MRSRPYIPKALRKANARLDERKAKVEQLANTAQKPKRRGLLDRLFGWMK